MKVSKGLSVAAAGLIAALQGAPASGALMVDALVTPLGGSFLYDVTVDNASADDFSLVTLDAPIADPLIDPSLTAPAGFLALYDDVLGLLDLVEDSALFEAGSIVSGFSFESGAGPDDGFFRTFVGLTTLGEPFTGEVSLSVARAVSEPGLAALLGAGVVLTLVSFRGACSASPTMEVKS